MMANTTAGPGHCYLCSHLQLERRARTATPCTAANAIGKQAKKSLTAIAERPVEQRLFLRPRLAQSCAARDEQATSKSMAQCLVVECVTLLKVGLFLRQETRLFIPWQVCTYSCTLEK